MNFNTLEVLKSPNNSIPKGEGWIRWLKFFQKQFKLSNKWSNISNDNWGEMQTLFIVVWWKVRLSDYLLKYSRSRLVVSHFPITFWNIQDPDWLFHWSIFLLQVMNETTNTKTILFSQHKSLNLRFQGEKQKFQEKKGFCFFRKKNLYFFLVF